VIVYRCDISDQPSPESATRGELWWMVAQDPDPGVSVGVVVRLGDEPALRRWERLVDGSGWAQYGHMVDYYTDITPPSLWSCLGECFAGTQHPVIAVWRRPDGVWVAGR
jgi:hypothetical protein